jgi:cysteine desulfurase
VAYLDHAATTPVLPEVRAAVLDAMAVGGNASSVHGSGRRARRMVEESREALAAALGARPSEVVFTSGGTESDNLAVKGLFWARRRPRVIASAVEHHAVLDAVEWLAEHEGAEVTWLEVDALGRVRPDQLAEALDDDVALVTVMWANNEVGTVQPVAELAALCRDAGVPFHTDAVQAVGQLPVDFGGSGVQALTMTGHKLGGPLGAGALLLDRAADLTAQLHGGGQERDVRSGTLNAPLIVGLALATQIAVGRREAHATEVAALRDDLVARVRHVLPDTVLHGDPIDRLPGNAHLGFPGCEGDSLLLLLDAQGIEVSTGSACSAGVATPSHVLTAMGVADPRSALRITLGHSSTSADVDALVAALPVAVERVRA